MFSEAHYYHQMGTENSKMRQNLKLIFQAAHCILTYLFISLSFSS